MAQFAGIGQMLLQAALTALVGVGVYVAGKIIERTFLEPINEQRRVITEIVASLVMYANLYTFVETDINSLPDTGRQAYIDAQQVMRKQAAELSARSSMIQWYGLWALLRLVPSRANIEIAVKDLIGISNSTPSRDLDGVRWTSEWRDEIMRSLVTERSLRPARVAKNNTR